MYFFDDVGFVGGENIFKTSSERLVGKNFLKDIVTQKSFDKLTEKYSGELLPKGKASSRFSCETNDFDIE